MLIITYVGYSVKCNLPYMGIVPGEYIGWIQPTTQVSYTWKGEEGGGGAKKEPRTSLYSLSPTQPDVNIGPGTD